MMDSPFYRSRWGSSSRYPPNFRTVPVGTSQTTPLPSPLPSHKPKVVSIPVHFIQSAENVSKPDQNNNSRSDEAIRIQKLWRGFRVRKNVKKLLEIQRELCEVDRAILDSETVDAIRRDERERLKVSERLMSLLFRLDSISGFNCAIKDLRKTLIRRAIFSQEKVDSIAVLNQAEAENSIKEPPESNCDNQPLDDTEDRNPQDLKLETPEAPNCEDEDLQSDSESSEHNEQELKEEEPVEKEVVVVKEENSNTNTMEESKRSREMLERMVEENKQLMSLMADLFERNEMQTRILSSLSERVGHLENAFACEKLRRRAKKQRKNKNAKSLDNEKAYF